MLFSELYSEARKNGGALPVPVNVCLDEFCNVGKFPKFVETISTARSRNIGIQIILQSLPSVLSAVSSVLYGTGDAVMLGEAVSSDVVVLCSGSGVGSGVGSGGGAVGSHTNSTSPSTFSILIQLISYAFPPSTPRIARLPIKSSAGRLPSSVISVIKVYVPAFIIPLLKTAGTIVATSLGLRYADETFPFDVRTVIYKSLIDNMVNCHWHQDFEYGLLLEGSVDCAINETHLKLNKGDIFFINSNVLHMSAQSNHSKDAVMFTLTFPASFVTANITSSLYTKYFTPLLTEKIDGFTIAEENSDVHTLRDFLVRIYELEPAAFGYELECLGIFSRLWLKTLNYINENRDGLIYRANNMRYSERMKGILSYIHTHYNEKMIAEDIAKYVNISRGECFRCFKHYMGKTIIEYTNAYRLQRAAAQLRETEKRLIDISADCGFENASYFSKHFKDAYSITPLQYRKATIWTENTLLHTNGYDYEYWKDTGNGTMIITAGANNGAFSCEWYNVGDIMFRSGKNSPAFKGNTVKWVRYL